MTTPLDREEAESRVRELRSTFDHPVIDADGHLLENMPLLFGTLDRLFGLAVTERAVRTLREDPVAGPGQPDTGTPQGPWWGIPNDTDDVATASIPGRLAERMEALGFDYAVVYPTVGLGFLTVPDAEVRQPLCRALNVMNAELTSSHRRHMTVAAVIPMHHPDEALEELEFVRTELTSKVVVIPPGVARPLRGFSDAFPAAHELDRFGLDSRHDYDPVWQFVSEHDLALSVHGGAGYKHLPPAQGSSSNFVANHLLGHASLMTEIVKSLVLGGVYDRFPDLKIAYLEGGAGWAVDLMHSMYEHFEKRGPEGLGLLDPSAIDVHLLGRHFRTAGMPVADPTTDVFASEPPFELDEWASSGLTHQSQIVELFRSRMFVGCEGDDRSVRQAFDTVGNLEGVTLGAIFSSDIGHWDVPRLADVLLHSRALVDEGAISDGDYRDFVFANAVRFHAGADPAFFDATNVADAVSRELGEADGI